MTLYLEYLSRDLQRPDSATNPLLLDAGCGTGRIALHMAASGYRVVGIDTDAKSIAAAQERARHRDVDAHFAVGDLYRELRKLDSETFSVVLCLEVLYTCPDYLEILREFRRILRPGGVVCVSLASRRFLLTSMLRRRNFDGAKVVCMQSEGVLRLSRIPTYYRWATSEDCRKLLASMGFRVQHVDPILRFCGTGNDGMAGVFDLESVESEAEVEKLFRIEMEALPKIADEGKYIYVSARKPR